jgi:hypothetical protein
MVLARNVKMLAPCCQNELGYIITLLEARAKGE